MDFRFLRSERLKSDKVISLLFKKGQSFSCYPLRLVYIQNPHLFSEKKPLKQEAHSEHKVDITADDIKPIQFSLSVPKKNFKRAVDRNILRRRIREAYRLHKHEIYDFLEKNHRHSDNKFAFMVIYTAKELLSYKEIEKGIGKMIIKFKQELGN